eukprot:gnl/MRDRNA2_/MRDRNA2_61619_c0_seq1.p1 gnl/MRDRNA2_/MRDRNA2_61619_c0~~gnl/MRDRNA2_/MRDRNA2_61619_c0_seq1.p1  ORF type:complete len:108 (+),score=17.09 gnl/MRDRNA2_/MRDRNA2_61619_c0_seq1:166-489(+)
MNFQELEPLVRQTVEAAGAGEIGARELANVAYGAARSGKSRSLGLLFDSVMIAAVQCMSDFKAQELSNMAWAFASAAQSDKLLFAWSARAAKWRIVDSNALNLASIS